MKILPMDIQRQNFGRVMRGFDIEEVRTYLTIVAEEVAALQGERDSLSQEVQSLRTQVEDHRQRENILKNTLLTAQRVSEEIKENANRCSLPSAIQAKKSKDFALAYLEIEVFDGNQLSITLRK